MSNKDQTGHEVSVCGYSFQNALYNAMSLEEQQLLHAVDSKG